MCRQRSRGCDAVSCQVSGKATVLSCTGSSDKLIHLRRSCVRILSMTKLKDFEYDDARKYGGTQCYRLSELRTLCCVLECVDGRSVLAGHCTHHTSCLQSAGEDSCLRFAEEVDSSPGLFALLSTISDFQFSCDGLVKEGHKRRSGVSRAESILLKRSRG